MNATNVACYNSSDSFSIQFNREWYISKYANYNAPLNFKHIHDVRLVRALEASVCAHAESYYP